jgi:hypothetical protein
MIAAEPRSRARLAVALALLCAGLLSRAMRGAEPEAYGGSVFVGRSAWVM